MTTTYAYHVGRGHGPLQRWLLTCLPPACERPSASAGTMVTAAQLAYWFYETNRPSVAQVDSVRRALRRLEEQNLVQRWELHPGPPGGPSFWTQPKR
jgi:hypothetical protein